MIESAKVLLSCLNINFEINLNSVLDVNLYFIWNCLTFVMCVNSIETRIFFFRWNMYHLFDTCIPVHGSCKPVLTLKFQHQFQAALNNPRNVHVPLSSSSLLSLITYVCKQIFRLKNTISKYCTNNPLIISICRFAIRLSGLN